MKEIKPRRCKVCKELYTPKRIGLKLTPVCLNAGCVLDYAQGVRAKEADKAHRIRKAEFKDNDKSLQRKKAQKAFNEFIRIRDAGDGCISCDKDKDWQGQWHAGHYKTTASRPDLRFDPVNCNKQCSVCNNYLSGNLVNYRDSLIKKWGMPALNLLELDQPSVFKTAADFKEIYDYYRKKIKELKSVN